MSYFMLIFRLFVSDTFEDIGDTFWNILPKHSIKIWQAVLKYMMQYKLPLYISPIDTLR